MYIPAYFRKTDLPEIEQFLRQHAFAVLISSLDGTQVASHIPLELDTNKQGESILSGHISRANPQWKSFSNGENVLAIFQGPHTYVSSSWYNHMNVPTWNYISVHVYGKMKIIEGAALLEKLEKLVTKYEEHSKKPFNLDQMPEEMMEKYLKGIVGFEMSMEKIEGKWKLSQNRESEDYQNIIRELDQLESDNAKSVAAEMKKIKH